MNLPKMRLTSTLPFLRTIDSRAPERMPVTRSRGDAASASDPARPSRSGTYTDVCHPKTRGAPPGLLLVGLFALAVLFTLTAHREARAQAPPIIIGEVWYLVINENNTAVTTLEAVDPDSTELVWTITGGADQNAFSLTASDSAIPVTASGSAKARLAFRVAKDFEAPDDADGDNVYEVSVEVTDGDNPVGYSISVRIADVDESSGVTSNPTVTLSCSSSYNDRRGLDNFVVVVEFSEFVWDFDSDDLKYTRQPSHNTQVVVSGGTVGAFSGLRSKKFNFGTHDPESVQYTFWVPAAVAHDVSGDLNRASGTLRLAMNRKVSIAADARASEESGATADFRVMLDAVDDCETATVEYETADGTATAGEDYTAASGTLTFAPGQTAKTVSVAVLDDSLNDSGETFTLKLKNLSAETTAIADDKAEATGTITDSDRDVFAPRVASASVDGSVVTLTFNEGLDESSEPAAGAFTVTVAGATRGVTTVDVSGNTLTLTLASAVAAGEAVTVAYAQPADANARRLEDTAGNPVASFGARTVTNDTNAPPTGLPTIAGIAQVGETLTASSSGIADADGLSGATFAWQWVVNDGATDTDIPGATQASYTLTNAEAVKTIKVRLTFTDDRGTDETLVSAATAAVVVPLTAQFVNMPAFHDGSRPIEFELRFSEEIAISYRTVRGAVLDVTGGTVKAAWRLARPSNMRWGIRVAPATDGDVRIMLRGGRACDAKGAICTSDRKRLSNGLESSVRSSLPTVGSDTFEVVENQTDVTTLTATDADTPVADLVWSITGGADAAKFTLGASGVLAFKTAKDFESPDDTDGDGSYEVAVQVSDGTNTASATLTVTLVDVEEVAPTLTGATVNGEQLTLTFSESLVWASSGGIAFAVTVAETARPITLMQHDGGSTILLRLAEAVEYGDTVRVSYLPGTYDARFQDEAGNELEEFRDQVVENGTPDSGNSADTAAVVAPLTASFEEVPATHDGASPFEFRIAFSEVIEASWVTMRDHALEVTGGRVTAAWRVERRSDLWGIRIVPDSTGAVAVVLAGDRACTESGAICTSDDKQLSGRVAASVAGPAPLSTDATLSALRLSNGALNPSFASATTGYTASVPYATASLTVEPTPNDANATVAFNPATDAESGAPGHQVALTLGDTRITVTVTAEDGSTQKTYTVTVTRRPNLSVTGLVLYDNASGEDVAGLTDGAVVSAQSSARLNIRADTSGSVGSVRLELSGQETASRTENMAPWYLFGDQGNRGARAFPAGSYTVMATPYSEPRAGGTAGDTLRVSFRVKPHELSVADASAEEGTDTTLDFTVTLAPSSPSAVTVAYATADGTATAGEDYEPKSGTLTFAAGETTKTVSVTLLDDVRNEGSETFTLTLNSATGATITDAEATGTITNSDPLPTAWTARFGRAAAVHVLDAVSERLDGGSAGASHVRLGGHQLGGGLGVREAVSHLAPARSLLEETETANTTGQDMTLKELLLHSSFHLVSNDGGEAIGPRLSAWGRVAASGFDGKEDRLSLDGTVTTATLGVDGAWEHWLTGLAVAYSEGDGSFSQVGIPGGDLASTLTSVHPYVAYTLSDRVRLWGMVGYGSGEFSLSDPDTLSTDLEMRMGAVGVRGTLLSQPKGLELALRSDALWVGIDTAAVQDMVATEAETSRLRLVLEGSRAIALSGGGILTPALEIGLRHDGGDAETGSGLELGGRIRYASAWGLSIEASVRGLLAHEDQDYQEWAASGSLRFDPGQDGRGLSASIAPTWGMASSGVGQLWGQPDARGLAPNGGLLPTSAAGRLEAQLGYGLATLQGRGLLTPYARVALTEGSEQAWHLGTRLALAEILDLSLEASRRQREGEGAAHDLALLATVPW